MKSLKSWPMSCLLTGTLLAAGCSMLGMGKGGPERVTAEENPGATSPSARNVMHASVKLTGHAVR